MMRVWSGSWVWRGARVCAAVVVLAAAAPVRAQSLQDTVAAITQQPDVARAHWGISVVKMDGTSVLAINDGQFFQPASNAKLFTTATAMALLPTSEQLVTNVIGSGYYKKGVLQGDLVLRGVGDANLSGRQVPYQPPPANLPAKPAQPNVPAEHVDGLRYIRDLAAQVKASGVTRINGDIVGDDALFPWQPYPEDWTIDDAVWGYGAPVSGLMVNDDALSMTVIPGAVVGAQPSVTFDPSLPYYTVDMQATTAPPGTAPSLDVQRAIGSRVVHVYGALPAGAPAAVESLSIDDPAEYAAMALKSALADAGVMVSGAAKARHQPYIATGFTREVMQPLTSFDPLPVRALLLRSTAAACNDCSPQWSSRVLASHTSASFYDDIVVTNKVSENQHAELLLRQIGFFYGSATTQGGARVVRSWLTQKAGIDPGDFTFEDGSGLSGHDLVTPRSITQLLRFAATQPWGSQWKASLPVAGVDGTLRLRFADSVLKGRVAAKTGTLGEVRALSGYLQCASGQTVTFSILVNAHAPHSHADEKATDRILEAIAAAE